MTILPCRQCSSFAAMPDILLYYIPCTHSSMLMSWLFLALAHEALVTVRSNCNALHEILVCCCYLSGLGRFIHGISSEVLLN